MSRIYASFLLLGSRYDKLKEDFKFNLGLIEDRDAELGRYEAAIQGLKECLRDKVDTIAFVSRVCFVFVGIYYASMLLQVQYTTVAFGDLVLGDCDTTQESSWAQGGRCVGYRWLNCRSVRLTV